MSSHVYEILRKLEIGLLNADQASDEMKSERSLDDGYDRYCLRAQTVDMDDNHVRVHIRIPMRMFKTGLDLGAVYVPDLNSLNLHQVITDLGTFAHGSILEVEDYESMEGVMISLDHHMSD